MTAAIQKAIPLQGATCTPLKMITQPPKEVPAAMPIPINEAVSAKPNSIASGAARLI